MNAKLDIHSDIEQFPKRLTELQILDIVSTKAIHLSAMLNLIRGAGHENFQNYSDEIQESYIWACSDMADEIKKLTENY